MLKGDVTILVNTSDGFEDCWFPFFKIFKENWKECPFPILLNTEFKEFKYEGLDVISSKVHEGIENRRLTWSECLIRGLNQIKSPLILYLQEDYFLTSAIEEEKLLGYIKLMQVNPQIRHIGLTNFGSRGPFSDSGFLGLKKIGQKNSYRVSTQAGLWRRETLLSLIEPYESGWMFEIFGTKRSARKKELFLTVDPNRSEGIFSYIFTGIIKGKWHTDVPELFGKYDLYPDFNKRGFINSKNNYFQEKYLLYSKMILDPALLLKSLRSIYVK